AMKPAASFVVALPLVAIACSSSSADATNDGGSNADAAPDTTVDVGLDDATHADGGCVDFVAPAACTIDDTTGLPTDLACAGLYGDFASRTVACGVRAFTPGYQLWSDAAHKKRWIALPAGAKIDDSTPAHCTFP